ncbi:TIR domain-containing protein [Novosphingobium sp.]|uniref:TIR domain-containing protein n=1 Tax=Novosphingobium sp. TaxID=1874826 RepID=UPI00370372EF
MPPEGTKGATVFLSYSREDQKRALPVIKALEAGGLQVWWDGLLEGGDSFLPTTEAALESADAVVVLWSNTSVNSHWVRDEAQRGRERGCLVPLRIDDAKPPLGFRQFQVIDISHWNGKPSAPQFERVIRAINGFAGQAPTEPMPQPHQPPVSRRAILGGGVAVLAGGSALALWQFWPGRAEAAPGNSVAVLPFGNLSGDADQDYFAEGIAEQIRLTLSRNSNLLVLAPASISAVTKDGIADLKSIAAKLGVAYVLDGKVRRSGDLLRISATLTNGKSGFPDWTNEFDEQLKDVFTVQDGIAQEVAKVMAAQTVSAGTVATKGPGGTTDIKAYDAYLRGNAYYELRSGEAAYRSALAQYDIAIAQDSKFGSAHAARARLIVVITNAGSKANEFKAAYEDALASARKAVELAPELASAHATLGFVLAQGKLDLRAAVEPYEQARKLGDGDAGVLSLYSAFSAQTGRKAAAESAATRAIRLDPLNPGVQRLAAFVAYCARDWATTIERSRKALALNPKVEHAHAFIGDALYQKGQVAEAKAEFTLEPDGLARPTGLAIVAYRLGDTGAAKQAVDGLTAKFGDAASYQFAQIYSQAGEIDQALSTLRHAREIGDVGLAQAYTDPMLDPLRSRPEFSRLLMELGFG